MSDWGQIAEGYWRAQPSPHNPSLTNGELSMFVRLATKAKYGGHASHQEAGAFATEFKSMNQSLMAKGKDPITPEEMGHLLERISPVSFALHGRPPTMSELVRHREAEPNTVQKYYSDLPDQHYPHVTAGQMAKMLALAEEPAQSFLGRSPVKLEASRFALGNLGFSDIIDYYRGISGIKQSTEGGLWTPPAGGFGAPPEGSDQPQPNPLPPLGPWQPEQGTFGARPGGGQDPGPDPLPPLGPWQPEPGTFGARSGGNQEVE